MNDMNPTAYAALLDRALDRPLPAWREAVQRISDAYVLSLTDMGIDCLRQAYVAGLSDGFAQGVEAEAKRWAVDA